jgi:hypothetical protein
MTRRDEYHAKAEHCREMAETAITPLEKEGWLQQATNWLTLSALSDRECREKATEMNDPSHKKKMEVMAEIWETLVSRLSKETYKA